MYVYDRKLSGFQARSKEQPISSQATQRNSYYPDRGISGFVGHRGISDSETPSSDGVDAFLESRRSLYKVMLVGTNIHVTLPRSYEWTARYTNRALTEGAVGAAINAIYMGGATAAQVRKAYEQVVGRGVKLTPATKQMHGEGAIHMTIIDDAARAKIAQALNLPPKFMTDTWRAKFGEAKMIEFALGTAYRSLERLVPHFSAKALAASTMSVDLIRHLLDKRFQSMIEVAKRHPAAAPWRDAYKRNLALHWAEREPVLTDFDKVPLSQWAKIVLELATATRNSLNEQIVRKREEDRKHARNEHLRPHEIKVDDAAKFILENFEPTHKERLHTTSWIVHGGQQLSNIKNEPIFLLRVESGRVIYQHLGNKKLASFIAPRKYFTLFSWPRSGVGTQFRHVSVVVRMDSGRDAPGTGTKHRLDTGRKCKPRNEGCQEVLRADARGLRRRAAV